MMEHSEAVRYLQATNIVRLQAAARMAGLRWKNGEPGTDKAGIIARLERTPSIMRATVATLERMARGESAPPAPKTSLMDDLEDELSTPSEASAPEPTTEPPKQTPLAADMSRFALKTDVIRLGEAVHADQQALRESVGEWRDEVMRTIEVLQTRRPIQINIPERKPILINPDEKHSSFPRLIRYLQINRRVILTGSAGTGKSMAVRDAADALGVPFYLVPPVTMSHELIGHRDAQGVFHETPLTLAFKHGGLCLLDEADASLPDALLCANPIFDGNGFATLGDGMLHTMHPDFMAVFNMNTDGNGATMQYAGRNRLDGATLARFGVRIHWEIDARIESMMAGSQKAWHAACVAVRDFMVSRDIVDVNATPRHVKTGAMLLDAGCPAEEVLTDVLKSGALAEAWNEVERLPQIRNFLRG